ncbi:uncharacterized protein LOC118203018 [Stegodyphus dumicola]|uniref:uncharacterized protein LOC118203018 n=1 Tax=Stegodyphus dumicola TaxID=202533 RepID=UPI0015AC98F4|nr:uncharacterized protein LOC118203018 [Stegodyphus dumicola]
MKHRLVHNAVPCSPKSHVTKNAVSNQQVPNLSDTPFSSAMGNHLISPVPVQGPSNQQTPVACSTSKSHYSAKKYTPRKSVLANTVKKFWDMARQLKLKVATSERKSIAYSFEKTLFSQRVSKKCSFIQRQVILNTQKTKGRRFTQSDKIDAYRIYSKSRAAYRVLKEFLQLPDERTLQRFVSSKLAYAGISADVIFALKQVLQNKEKHEKMFALIFDEVSLKPSLVYDRQKDHVVGFEDFGGLRSDSFANHALVLMLRSLTSKKKVPLGFYFSSHAMNAERLRDIVMEALSKLSSANATVKALVCDQSGSNCRLFGLLGTESTKPFFYFNGQKVFCLFDPPHLLKNLRRSLMKYDLQTNKGLVSFKHIRDFYTVDQTLLVRCAPKITDAHIYVAGMNSMKVALAAQVFSHTVAAGMNMCVSYLD